MPRDPRQCESVHVNIGIVRVLSPQVPKDPILLQLTQHATFGIGPASCFVRVDVRARPWQIMTGCKDAIARIREQLPGGDRGAHRAPGDLPF